MSRNAPNNWDRPGNAGPTRWQHAWPWLRRALTLLFFCGLALLLVERGRALDWAEVGASLAAYDAESLVLAGLLGAFSYALYCSFDLFGRRYTGHKLSTTAVVSTAFVSYAFNLNLGALVGGIGFRYRLYSRYGLNAATITRVLGLSMLSNWLGYLPLAGAVLASAVVSLPAPFRVGEMALQILGVVLLLTAPAYLAVCAFSRRRYWRLRGLRIDLPHAPMALAQLGLSTANWLSIAGVVWMLLGGAADYPSVLAALLLGAIAGVLTHVPAGLGVLEAVFLALLGGRINEAPILAALLAYRALYYLLPGLIALLVYLGLEAKARWRPLALRSSM
ncbi:MAG: hypothetical protein JWQ90_999 [Hydrocarboniphaga sp.]|uniref:lysylphosphatidylglycerol synthase domain-containing protein n=1 Tax=Hydrocarboniphaga sp. TaxID=2033016 RepID=UPI002621C890|nr:lysylphosphatidylglycerol synthase domain-containing protein [Hydrocarboniphaga sp.]MDB5968549.1 hypothetical protein [Hydrocarboniphaga sp.]